MTKQDLIKEAFNSINAFKRHRVKMNIDKANNRHQDVQYHELKQYQYIDNLELALRAIQKEIRWDNEEEAEKAATH